MSKSEIRRLEITDPIKTEAGKELFEWANMNYGSIIWGPVLRGIIAIEKELDERSI